jgi:hypothetical protein
MEKDGQQASVQADLDARKRQKETWKVHRIRVSGLIKHNIQVSDRQATPLYAGTAGGGI